MRSKLPVANIKFLDLQHKQFSWRRGRNVCHEPSQVRVLFCKKPFASVGWCYQALHRVCPGISTPKNGIGKPNEFFNYEAFSPTFAEEIVTHTRCMGYSRNPDLSVSFQSGVDSSVDLPSRATMKTNRQPVFVENVSSVTQVLPQA